MPITTVQINSSTDDVEERASGSVNFTSSDIELVDDNPSRPGQTIGLRFTGVDIPQGAVIVSAYIQFQVDEVSTGAANLQIQGEDVDNAAQFANVTNDVTSRLATSTSETVAWSPPEWLTRGEAGADQQTSDISAIIQEIVNRTGWSSGNALALLVTGSGERTAESFDGVAAAAPQLVIEWVSATGSPPTGFELTGNQVDENATSATVVGTLGSVIDPDTSDTHTFSLVDDAGGRFQIVGNQLQVADGSLFDFETAASHDVTVRVTDSGGQVLDQTFAIGVLDVNEAPNVVTPIADTFVIQDQALNLSVAANFADDDTSHGDSLTYSATLAGGGALPSWLNFNDSTGQFSGTPTAANLGDINVTVTASDAFGPLDVSDTFTLSVVDSQPDPTIVESRIAVGTDDVEERSSGSVNFNSSDIELVDDNPSRPGQTIGLRFTGLDIPQGANIVNAYIQFQVDEVSTGTANLQIQGEDVDNAAVFANVTNDVTSRLATATSATVAWSPPEWLTRGEAGADQQTSDISAIIQEIVNRTGWSSGNALALLVTGSGERTAESFNGVAAAAPLLHVEYLPAGPASDPVVFNNPPDSNIAVPDQIAENAAAGAEVGITASASDPDPGDTVIYSIDDTRFAIDPGTGVITLAAPGTLDFETEPQIDVTVTATSSDFSTATQAFPLTVLDVNEPPVANVDIASTPPDTAININVLANDSDPDGNALDVTTATNGAFGTTVVNADNTVTYTPNPGFNGNDSFTYTISDGFLTDTAQATVNVTNDPTPTLFQFAVFGDYGDNQPDGEQAVAALVDSWNVDFILTVGDNAYGSIPFDDAVGQHYSDYIGNYIGSYGPGSTINRFFPTLGNHDYDDNSAGPNGGVDTYLNYFTLPDNERYYDFQVGSVHYFAINSDSNESDGVTMGSTQAQWLQNALTASDAAFNVVYFHHTAYRSDGSGDSDLRWDFEAWGADAVFAGHSHTFDLAVRDDNGDLVDIPYVTTGLGGAGTSAPNAGANLVTVTDAGMLIEFYLSDGSLVDSYFVDAPSPGNPQFVNGNDIINGTAGEDYLWGLGGNDTLTGFAGNDILIGGDGDDLFVIGQNDGQDTIPDFTPGAGTPDILDLTAFNIGTALAFQAVATNQGSDVVVNLGGGDQLTLLGVQVSQFDDSDFVPTGPVNQPPTGISLDNVVTDIAENADLSSGLKVADIVVTDDGLGTNILSLSGADAPLFEIVGTELHLSAGAVLDFETNPSLDVTVEVNDASVGGSPDASASQTFTVTNVNEAPTAVTLTDVLANIEENTDTSSPVKVATIVVTDDALGTNVLSLTGTDAASFEIGGALGNELFLKAGTVLDSQNNPSFNVTVEVDDVSVGITPDASVNQIFNVTPVNEAPTGISLVNVLTDIAENANTSSSLKVADIVVTDDGIGVNELSLSGADAPLFEIVGTELHIAAGTVLDFESAPSLNVTVEVNDASVGTTPDASVSQTFNVTDVNEAPTAVTLTGLLASIAENTDTTTPLKVADISVTDDALGNNVLSLTGIDAALFEIGGALGNELFLKAGTALDFESDPSFDVTVEVNDASVGGAPDAFANQTFTVIDVNEPVAFDLNADADPANNLIVDNALPGTPVGITAAATDPDANDTVSYSVDDTRFDIDPDTGIVTRSGTGALDFVNEPTITLNVTANSSDGTSDTQAFTLDVLEGQQDPTIVESRISVGTDDVEERASGSVNFASSDLELVDDNPSRPGQTIGLRFNGLDIPQGAIIVNAYVQFQVDEVSIGTATLQIQGEDVDNAAPFANVAFNVSTRTPTANTVAWSVPDWPAVGAAGPAQQTDDISSIIQEIVSRPGWTNNNSIALIITGSGERTAEAFDGVAAAAPLLHIEYLPPGPPVVFNNPADANTADPDHISETAGAGTLVGITASATDPDGDTVTYSVDDERFDIDPDTGVVTRSATGIIDYESEPTITLTVRATSSDGSTGTHDFAITVDDVPEVPVANADSASAQSGIPIVIDVLANDNPGDGPAFITSFDAVSAQGGTVTDNSDGTLTYTAGAGFTGLDTFDYTITDSSVPGDSSTAMVTVNVIPPLPPSSLTLVNTVNAWQWSPPSPDSSGIVYLDHLGTLLVSDGEVNEIPALFTGDNLFQSDLSGTLVSTLTAFGFSDEPTGAAYNPSNQHLFFSDDTGTRSVYELDPGPDGLYNTADDIVTSFGTSAYGNSDPEGVTYDTLRGFLHVVDGAGGTVYTVDPGPNGLFDGVASLGGDDIVTSFSTSGLGIVDPEGIAYDPVYDLLYIIASNDAIAQVTMTGELVGMLDISMASIGNAAGLAFGPGSLDPNATSLYVAARGVDNNSNPNENDGMVFEFSFDDFFA